MKYGQWDDVSANNVENARKAFIKWSACGNKRVFVIQRFDGTWAYLANDAKWPDELQNIEATTEEEAKAVGDVFFRME